MDDLSARSVRTAKARSLNSLVGFLGAAGWKRRPLRDLLRWADELSAGRDPSLEVDGCEGHKGSLSIMDFGLILHAYFSGNRVRFEIHDHPESGKDVTSPVGYSLHGSMSVDCLKDSLRLLAAGRSPVDHIISESDEIWDDVGDD